jgi:hypothetical protein
MDPLHFPFCGPEPWRHQREAFLRSAQSTAFAYLMEQRTGKSKVNIDVARFMHAEGKIDALVVAAMPGRVHRNWVVNELPAHLPKDFRWMGLVWEAGRVNTKGYRELMARLLSFDGLAVLAVNGEAMITSAFRDYATRFYAKRRVLTCLDEYTLVVSAPGSKRTKLLMAMGRRSVARRINDGTPGENPFDLYAPYQFLDVNIHGYTNFTAFKHRYARWKKGHRFDQATQSLVEFPTLDRGENDDESPWVNMDELRARIAPHSFRVLRKDCWDVPEKVYQTVTFRLTPRQRAAYESLREEYQAELHDGTLVAAKHVLTRYLRLQQVASNYWPSEKEAVVHEPCGGEGCDLCDHLGAVVSKSELRRIDPDCNPRLEAFVEQLPLNSGPGIVWCRFQEDVSEVLRASKAAGRSPVRYDGAVSSKLKDQGLADLQEGRADLLVGSPASGGRGLRMDRARWIAFYSHYFSLLTRLQGEDRAEAQGRTFGTGIIDFAAEDTVDDTVIIPALRSKKTVMDYVMGERGGRWL